MNKNIIIAILVIFLSLLLLMILFFYPKVNESIRVQENKSNDVLDAPYAEVVLEDLNIPWDLEFLPDGSIFITERDGKLIHFNPQTKEKTYIDIPEVENIGEGGLLGVVLHPNFEENSLVYLYTTTMENGSLINKVLRYRWQDNLLTDETDIISGISAARNHNGGRIMFGPVEEMDERYLYVAVGDSLSPNLAQDLNSLAGKILRIKDDGTIPQSNPFGNEIYSYGHRNPQGLVWDTDGNLWSTEHGPSERDEINLIMKGENYGWPNSVGDNILPGTIPPVIHSGNNTWAPAGIVYWSGSIFFGGLRGQALYEAVLDGKTIVQIKEHYKNEFGRIRTVFLGPDDMFYITTSNRDGRILFGRDDKIIKLNPKQFRQ